MKKIIGLILVFIISLFINCKKQPDEILKNATKIDYSFEQIINKYKKLRSFEKDELIKNISGKKVIWNLYVGDVSSTFLETAITRSSLDPNDYFEVDLYSNAIYSTVTTYIKKEEAMKLKKGENVWVTGIIYDNLGESLIYLFPTKIGKE